MAAPISKNLTAVAVMREVTENVFVAPAAGGDFMQFLPGVEANGKKETISRDVVTSSIGQVAPRAGLSSAEASLPVEAKGSGVEGGTPEFGLVIEAALGATRAIATQTTTKGAGNTGSVLQIQDADISKFSKYDVIVVLEAGAHHPCYITAVDTSLGAANITVSPPRDTGSFPNSVVISKSKMYYTANDGHPTLSMSTYWGGEILQKLWGLRAASLSLSSFEVGKLPSWESKLQGLSFDRVNGAPAFTPAPDASTPPVVVSTACVAQDGVHLRLKTFSVAVSNEVKFMDEICDGRVASRITSRKVDGSFAPYMDDTDVSQFTKFVNQTGYSLFAWAANPSGVDGEIELGSLIAVVLPNCVTTEIPTGDVDGLLTDNISFSANRGADGTVEEMFVGFV